MAQQIPGAKPRTDLDFEHFRQRLMEEKALAEQAISGTRSQQDVGGLNDVGTNRAELGTGGDNHPGDLGTELQLREQDQALIENARSILMQIERALEKLDEGTYGLSDRSGEPILAERLEAVPYATMTAEEQSLQETT